jgi:hypothetical protein
MGDQMISNANTSIALDVKKGVAHGLNREPLTKPVRLASLPACQGLARQTGDSVLGRRLIKS